MTDVDPVKSGAACAGVQTLCFWYGQSDETYGNRSQGRDSFRGRVGVLKMQRQ